ncbi:MAG: PHP domain-containing protein, partial [Bifidobacteriaceae bacterium]|nr:PHP domain-containing protein [Bifidobacteriaceae bacterium]
MTEYAELHAHSAFSFLDGCSQPADLAYQAAKLGLGAMAITDHDGLYGVVQFADAAREVGLPTVFGAELTLGGGEEAPGASDPPGTHLLALARGPEGYKRLSRSIAQAYLAVGEKGPPRYDLESLGAASGGEWLILTGCRKGAVRRALNGGGALAATELDRLVSLFGRDNVAVEITDSASPEDPAVIAALTELAGAAGLPLVATGNVHYAQTSQFAMASAMAAIRGRRSLAEMDGYLPAGPVAALRSPAQMAARMGRHGPAGAQAVATAAKLAGECAFDLKLIAPRLPPAYVPAGHDEDSWLEELTWHGAAERYGPRGQGNVKAYQTLEHELEVIKDLGFPGYFLIMYEIVEFCRDQGILCQGRGSAANSAVCYALGVTAVDAVRYGLLFERFLA